MILLFPYGVFNRIILLAALVHPESRGTAKQGKRVLERYRNFPEQFHWFTVQSKEE